MADVGANAAGLLLASQPGSLEPVFTTGAEVAAVEQLQALTAEGPGVDALGSGRPTLVGDLSTPASAQRWPTFAPEASRLGMRGMYSLPLALGAIQVGVLDLYCDEGEELGPDELLDALVYADTALLLLLNQRSGITTPAEAHGDDDAGVPALWSAELHQAAGMVSVQLGTSVLDALVRLRSHAYRTDQPLTEVARAVVERRLIFRPAEPRLTE
ncbi:MAG TPA: GAF and ANTAR domain-containing protein [Pseudonocardiaceae bacterium]